MTTLNRVLSGLFDALLYPFRGLPPLVGLSVFAAVSSIGILLVFKRTSDQKALAREKTRIHAGIFEIRLMKDDPRAIFRAQSEIFWCTMRYMRLSLWPMLWVIVPMVILLAQLQFRFGYGGLAPGEPAIVRVRLAEGTPGSGSDSDRGAEPRISLAASSGVVVDGPMLWIPSLDEAHWRVRATEPGTHELTVSIGGEDYSKSVEVSSDIVRRSPVRATASLLAEIAHPVEPPLPRDAPVASIEVAYPEAQVWILGWHMHWMIAFFLLTLVFAFALRGPMRVEI